MALLVVVGQTIVIYAFLVAALSRLGRAQMAGLTPIGYLVVALLGSAVETGLYNGRGELWAGLASALAILLLDYFSTWAVSKWPRLSRRLVGSPVLLVHEGQILPVQLRQVRMSEEDLAAALRRHGYARVEEIRFAVFEVDGSVGVIPKKP